MLYDVRAQHLQSDTINYRPYVDFTLTYKPSLHLVAPPQQKTGLLDNAFGDFCKRALDVVGSASLLVACMPIMLLVALAIRLKSPGPVLFCHRRMGRNGQTFNVWKFRTMAVDAAERLAACLEQNPENRKEWEATQKLKNDPRVTPLGRFLRRTSLDELPQFWNVLVGDMSLIGPRPIVSDEIARYGLCYRFYRSVRPGLTGLWQVSGRSNTSYQKRVELDTRYVREWSLLLDAWILWKTIGVVLRPEGAY